MSRADTVNGIKVGQRQMCAEGEHRFAAYHGYCLVCGEDGWSESQRRTIQREQAQVSR